MPLLALNSVEIKKRRMVGYVDANGKGHQATILGMPGTSPSAPTPTGAITGGTLAAATYTYGITAVVGGVETLLSATATGVVASGTTGSVSVVAPTVAGATLYKLYGRTAGANNQLLIGSSATTTIVDTGTPVTPTVAPPTSSSATLLVREWNSNKIVPNVPKATARRGAGSTLAYHIRRA